MVFCPYCGQQFTRDEHLERHILTHTNVKPFRCLTCHMSFARRDLLQRHYTVHGQDQNQQEIPAANGMIPKSAGRTPIACVNCAKTKTRCDKKFPCSRCASKNLECTLRSTRRATKNAQRMELPPDGTVAAPPYTNPKHSPDSAPTGQANITPPQDHKPSSPEEPVPVSRSDSFWHHEKVSQQSQPMHQPYNSMPIPQQSTADANAGLPDVLSNTYQQSLAFPIADEFGVFGGASDGGTSPHFMIDWHQLQVPMDFNTLSDPSMMISTDMNMDCNAYGFDAGPNVVLPMLPDHNGLLLTPIESPQNSHCPELELHATSSYEAQHPRSVSIASTAITLSEIDTETSAIVTAQDSWSVFRCSPTIPSSNCPKTALLNLELLEQSLCDHKTWLEWRPGFQQPDSSTTSDHLTVMHLHESTRDKLLVITQSFLYKALEFHRDGSAQSHQQEGGLLSPRSHSGSSFVLLPPGRVLECFLRSYSNGFERYFPLSPRGILDVNELMHCQNDRAASLLVLMMIAQGASSLPSPEARMLTGGLIEACRISLFDVVERNITMSGDPFVLRAALLFTVQAAWSGDKWQMDIAMGQRGMYLAMLRHSGMLEATASNSITQQKRDVHCLWSDWVQDESRSRLVYSWAMADQELALLHDTAPLINVNELNLPMPDADRLWQAQSASQWSSAFENVHAFAGGHSSLGSGARPFSLRELFMRFLDGDMASLGQHMTPLQLRLLLLPLQSLVHQQAQLISCLSSKSGSQDDATSMFNANAARSKMGDIARLLKQWHGLAQQYLDANSSCAVMQASLTLFHLISLNTVTNFGEIESVARREDFDGSDQQLQWRHSRCIRDVEVAVFHCGQTLRHIKGMNKTTRPSWWAGAVYRAGLVLWADSLLAKQATPQNVNGICSVPGPSLAIDCLRPDHVLIARYLTTREGVPCVTKQDGSQMNVDNAFNVLQHCVQLVDDGNTTRLTDGIRSKLDRLSKR